MARRRPRERFPQLVEAATRVFIESGGFRRTQIGDVAKAMGVAKGTLYLYVESKEALFDLALRHADRDRPEPPLPVPTPAAGATIAYVRERLAESARFDALREAEGRATPRDMDTELLAVVDEVYAALADNRTAIKLIGTSALDLPELGELWYRRARGALNERLAAWIARRASEGHLRAVPDPVAAARFVTETASWFAVHRFWDPFPDDIDEAAGRETVRTVIARALLPEAP